VVIPKRPSSPEAFADSPEFAEAPTQKRNMPDELCEAPPPVRITTKLKKVELEAIVAAERKQRRTSGVRPAVSDEERERYERRRRETMPAPDEVDVTDETRSDD
jgi:hypothetical protein